MKNHFVKVLVAAGIGAAMLGATAGCSAGAESDSVSKLVVYGADPENTAIQPVLDAFGEENNVEVELISYPSADFMQQFTPAVNANSQIDVILANGQDVRTLQANGLLADLGDSVDTSGLIPGAVDPFTIEDKLYAVGIGGVNVTAFIYNQAIFDDLGIEAPKTLDDVRSLPEALAGSDIAPVSVPGGNVYLWPIWMMQMLQQSTDGQPIESTFDTLSSGEPGFDSAAYTDALEQMASLGAAGVFQNGWQGADQDQANSLFAQGKAAMFFGGSWDIASILTQAPDLDIKALPFPTFVDGVSMGSFGGAFPAAAVYGKVDASRDELARELVAYLASADVNEALLAGVENPIILPANASVVPETTNPVQEQLISEFLPVQSTFLDWYWPKEVTSVYQQSMAGLVDGTLTVDQVASEAQTAFEAAKAAGFKF